jgi:hypothetical protein
MLLMRTLWSVERTANRVEFLTLLGNSEHRSAHRILMSLLCVK